MRGRMAGASGNLIYCVERISSCEYVFVVSLEKIVQETRENFLFTDFLLIARSAAKSGIPPLPPSPPQVVPSDFSRARQP